MRRVLLSIALVVVSSFAFAQVTTPAPTNPNILSAIQQLQQNDVQEAATLQAIQTTLNGLVPPASNTLYTSLFEAVNAAGSQLFCSYVNRSAAAVSVLTEIVAINGDVIATEHSTINPNTGTAVGNDIGLAAFCRFTMQSGSTRDIVASGELKTATGERTSLLAQ